MADLLAPPAPDEQPRRRRRPSAGAEAPHDDAAFVTVDQAARILALSRRKVELEMASDALPGW